MSENFELATSNMQIAAARAALPLPIKLESAASFQLAGETGTL